MNRASCMDQSTFDGSSHMLDAVYVAGDVIDSMTESVPTPHLHLRLPSMWQTLCLAASATILISPHPADSLLTHTPASYLPAFHQLK
jgi:hypothetical protein